MAIPHPLKWFSRRGRTRVGFMRNPTDVVQILKTGISAGLAWETARFFFDEPTPVLAPISALITAQTTVYQSYTFGIKQAFAMAAGLAIASAASSLHEVNAITIGFAVAAALLAGRALRLGNQYNQMHVTMVLVLAFGASVGYVRVLDSLLGAVVGVVVNAAIAPPTHVRAAADRLMALADDISDLVDDIHDGLVGGTWSREQASGWLQRGRRLADEGRVVRGTIETASESLRLRPTRQSAHIPRLMATAECLYHTTAELRGVALGLADLAGGARGLTEEERELIPDSFVDLLELLTQTYKLLGRMQSRGDTRGAAEKLGATVRRANLMEDDVMASLGQPGMSDRFRRAYGSILDHAQRMIYEIDPERGPHRIAMRGYSSWADVSHPRPR